jgi:hypothetical protein
LAEIAVGEKKTKTKIPDTTTTKRAKRAKGVFTQEFALPKSSFDVVLVPDGNKRKRVPTITTPPLFRV